MVVWKGQSSRGAQPRAAPHAAKTSALAGILSVSDFAFKNEFVREFRQFNLFLTQILKVSVSIT